MSKLDQIRARSVYVIASEIAVKIGISASPLGRLAELSTASPFPLSLEFQIEATWYENHAADVERRVHSNLAARRMNGEWFKVSVAEAITEIEKELVKSRDDHFKHSDLHILVSSIREQDPELAAYWPIKLLTWRVSDRQAIDPLWQRQSLLA